MGSFCASRKSVAPRRMASHQVAPRCTTDDASGAYSIAKEPARRSVIIALRSAPSPTGRLCAFESAIAQRNRAGASKSSKEFPDCRKCFCALVRAGSAFRRPRARTARSHRPCARSMRPRSPRSHRRGRSARTWPCPGAAAVRSSCPTTSTACRSRSPGGR